LWCQEQKLSAFIICVLFSTKSHFLFGKLAVESKLHIFSSSGENPLTCFASLYAANSCAIATVNFKPTLGRKMETQ